jgi:hypothetical protein
MVKVMVGDKVSKEIASVALSNNIVQQRITDMAKNKKGSYCYEYNRVTTMHCNLMNPPIL